MFDVGTAILMHDPKVWGAFSGLFHSWDVANMSSGELDIALITWALAVSDAIQEWGRDVDLDAGTTDWRIPWDTSVRTIPGSPKVVQITITYRRELERRVRDLVSKARSYIAKVPEVGTSAFFDERTGIGGIWEDLGVNEQVVTEWSSLYKDLSAAAALSDLLSGKVDTKSRAWARSFCRCLPEHPNSKPLRQWMEGRLNAHNDKVESARSLGKVLTIPTRDQEEGEAARAARREIVDDLRRIAGFWRIPWKTLFLWRQPPGIDIVIRRQMCDADPGGGGTRPPRNEDATLIDAIQVSRFDTQPAERGVAARDMDTAGGTP